MIADPLHWLWVLGAAFAGSVIGGIGRFGTGVILTAVLVPLLGVKATVPVLALAGVIINAGRFWFYRADIDWPAALRVLAGAAPLLWLGTWLYARLDPRPLGLANGLASGMGVILVSLLLGSGLSGTAVLATDAFVSILIDLTRAALFGRFALLEPAALPLGLAIGLATLPGSALAAWLVRRMQARLHRFFMEALILLGGISIIVSVWRG